MARERFRTVLAAIEKREYLTVTYRGRNDRRTRLKVLPCRLEYSVKNDCFRILTLERKRGGAEQETILRMAKVEALYRTGEFADKSVTIDGWPTSGTKSNSGQGFNSLLIALSDREEDIVFYSGDQIVIFYGSNSRAYTRFGKITGLNENGKF